jgi:CxxC motif-containing protein (DUF1111 family)
MRIGGLLILCGLLAAGLVEPDDPIPQPGTAGAPNRLLSQAEQATFLRGRLLFDRDFPRNDGVGPVFNGDSCRACHHDPVVGGAGGIDLQVQRPSGGGLAQTHSVPGIAREEIPGTTTFVEERSSPSLLGLGLIETISEATILAGEDRGDSDMDGIRGFAHILEGGIVGRFGWKAQVPDLRSFLRDAMGNELGITVPDTGNTFGFLDDSDGVADPELSINDLEDILFFLQTLDFAPKTAPTSETLQGEQLFNTIGCAKCHTPTMDGVELYSDMLLHDVFGTGFQGVSQGEAISGLYRTAPLRGLRDTAPYFHDGRSENLTDAIERHEGEAAGVIALFDGLSPADKAALIAFLDSL